MTIEAEATKRPVEETEAIVDAPVEKKARMEINFDALQKQVEYYLSDANLKHDKFFHSKMSETEGGWLSLTHILACNKVKTITNSAADIVSAMKASSVAEVNEAGDAIRRKEPLPAFEGELARTVRSTNNKHPAVSKRPVMLGDFKFPNLTSAKKRVGEILKSRREGVIFKEGTPDYNLMLAVFAEHPNAAKKMEGMTGMKVDIAPHGGNTRCFHIVKGENKDQSEDISIVKAFAAFEEKLIKAHDEKMNEKKTVETSQETPVEESQESSAKEEVSADAPVANEESTEAPVAQEETEARQE